MEWQPIETAPKSIAPRLVSDGASVYAAWLSHDGNWYHLEGNNANDPPIEATHWMLFPEPPKKDA